MNGVIDSWQLCSGRKWKQKWPIIGWNGGKTGHWSEVLECRWWRWWWSLEERKRLWQPRMLTDWKEKLPKVVHIYSRPWHITSPPPPHSRESEKVRKGKERNQEENSSSLQRKERRMCSVRKMRMRNSGEQTNRQMCVCVCVCVVTTIVEERERETKEKLAVG